MSIDQETWELIAELVRNHHPIMDTRSRGDLTIRIYDRQQQGQLLLAMPMTLIQLMREYKPQKHSAWPSPEVLVGQSQLEYLPDGQLIWAQWVEGKIDVLEEAIRWCQKLDVHVEYYESMQNLVDALNANQKSSCEGESARQQPFNLISLVLRLFHKLNKLFRR